MVAVMEHDDPWIGPLLEWTEKAANVSSRFPYINITDCLTRWLLSPSIPGAGRSGGRHAP
eukprot:803835-Prorocentrum_minimum.AAC.1